MMIFYTFKKYVHVRKTLYYMHHCLCNTYLKSRRVDNSEMLVNRTVFRFLSGLSFFRDLETCRKLYQKQKNDPPILRNLPPVRGACNVRDCSYFSRKQPPYPPWCTKKWSPTGGGRLREKARCVSAIKTWHFVSFEWRFCYDHTRPCRMVGYRKKKA